MWDISMQVNLPNRGSQQAGNRWSLGTIVLQIFQKGRLSEINFKYCLAGLLPGVFSWQPKILLGPFASVTRTFNAIKLHVRSVFCYVCKSVPPWPWALLIHNICPFGDVICGMEPWLVVNGRVHTLTPTNEAAWWAVCSQSELSISQSVQPPQEVQCLSGPGFPAETSHSLFGS